ncbi:MAG: CoA-binding protein [Candidatus Shapirobacteria bacterium]
MKTVVIVGLSNNPQRPSYQVGLYLKNHGFNIIPVNPTITDVFGIKSYPSILEIPHTIQIDIVDIFRHPDQVIPVIEEVVKSGHKPLIWMQEGVGSPQAKAFAEENGLEVVMDMCMMKEKVNSK